MRTLISIAVVITSFAPAQPQYKKAHRNALRNVVDGKAEAVLQRMRKRIALEASDPEDWFTTAIAAARLGDVDTATDAATRALALGLPEGRLAAACHDWLRPIRDREPIRGVIDRMRTRPIMGPMVGAVGPTDARIWVRTVDEVDVAVKINGKVAGKGRTSASDDFASIVHVTGLTPRTRYSGQVLIAGSEPETANRFAFTTAPAADTRSRFTLAFGGGAGFTPMYERMWTTMADARPDLLLLLGDNVYIDHPKHPDVQRYCYHRRQASPPFRALVRQTPTFSIWDDHDFGTNDCHGGPNLEKPKWKRPVWDIFRHNWANPGYGGGKDHPGCWYRFAWGDVDFFMLDGRTWRTKPRPDGEGTMLGPEQKAWLMRELATSKGTFKVICSPVPWAVGTKGGSKDTWDGFPRERAEIFDFLAEKKIDGVVLMSADRHRSDAWLVRRNGAYDLYEFNSSRLTNVHTHKTMKKAIFSYNRTPSFGLVTFDTRGDPDVVYEVVTIDGIKVHRLEVPLKKLRHH